MNERESKFALRKEMKKCQKRKPTDRLDARGVGQLHGESLISVTNADNNSVLNVRAVGRHGDICMNTHIALPVEQKRDRRW